MGLEDVEYISDLVSDNPEHDDFARHADDHLRLLKRVLQTTFPNADAPILLEPSGNDLLLAANLTVETLLANALYLADRADHVQAPTAGSGELWLRTGTPNVIVFTDEDGTDWVLNTRELPASGSTGQVLVKASATDYDVEWSSDSGLPAGGTRGQLLYKDSSADGDASWRDTVPTPAADNFTPGYDYTKQSDTTFTVDLVSAASLFKVSRRIRFSKGGVEVHGVISAVDFDSTHADDTFVTVVMEGGDVIPTDSFEVTFVTSATSWVDIGSSPFGADEIYDICTGQISGQSWWMIVGVTGQVGFSDDAGATWDTPASGTTEDLNCCCFDPNYERFWAGGDAGVLVYSDNGISCTADIAMIATIDGGTGTNDIWGIVACDDVTDPGVWCCFQNVTTSSGWRTGVTADNGVTWATADSTCEQPVGKASASPRVNGDGTFGPEIINPIHNNTSIRYYQSTRDVSPNSNTTSRSTKLPAAIRFESTAQGNDCWVCVDINAYVEGDSGWAGDDALTFVGSQPQQFCFSPAHDRLVAVCANGIIGYWDGVNGDTNDTWVLVSNGFSNTARINACAWSPEDGVFVAVAHNGQICRSSTGTL